MVSGSGARYEFTPSSILTQLSLEVSTARWNLSFSPGNSIDSYVLEFLLDSLHVARTLSRIMQVSHPRAIAPMDTYILDYGQILPTGY